MSEAVGNLPGPLHRLAVLLAPAIGGPPPPAGHIDEDLVALALRRHQVGPLLHGAAMQGGYAMAPDLLRKLAESYSASAARRAPVLARLERIAAEFARRDIGWMTIKGAVQAERLYADPAWRDSADIDILVDPGQFHSAFMAFIDLGYIAANPPMPSWHPLQKAVLGAIRDVGLVPRDDLACSVELHRRLFFPDDRHARLPRLRAAPGPIPAPALTSELAFYLVAHGATSFWVRLKWLVDLVPLLGKLEQAEIAAVAQHARRACAQNATVASLLLLRALFPFARLEPLDPWLEHKRHDPGVQRRLARYVETLSLERDWRASPLDNARLSLESQLLVFESASSRANILLHAPVSSAVRRITKRLWKPDGLPDWDEPPS